MTRAELRLWSRLRKPGLPGLRFRRHTTDRLVHRQVLCPERGLIVEIDGDQHGLPAGDRRDRERDAWLHRQGYRVLRFWNSEVMTNIEGVCEAILAAAPPSLDEQ